MAIQIVLSHSKESEEELIKMGFNKTEVYTKLVDGGGNTDEQIKIGDTEFFSMKNKPYQFLTSSWWGASVDY